MKLFFIFIQNKKHTGHEIAHAFDTGTRKELNDKNLISLNNLTSKNASVNTSWWPKQLNDEYENKSQCFVRQFNNYFLDEINENVSSLLMNIIKNVVSLSLIEQCKFY